MWHRLCWISPESSTVPDFSEKADSSAKSDCSIGSFESNSSFLRDYDEHNCFLELSSVALDTMPIPRTPVTSSGRGQPLESAAAPNTRRNPPQEYLSIGDNERQINVVPDAAETDFAYTINNEAAETITRGLQDVPRRGGSTRDVEDHQGMDDLSHLGAAGGVFSVQNF